MATGKYVIVQTEEDGEIGFIFPASIPHDQFARRLWKDAVIVSAGFVRSNDEPMHIEAYGESVSLNKKSRGFLDTIVLGRLFQEVF
jgi:hypothetical protein